MYKLDSVGWYRIKRYFLYETKNERNIANYHVAGIRKYRSRVIAKSNIEEIYELEDIGLK